LFLTLSASLACHFATLKDYFFVAVAKDHKLFKSHCILLYNNCSGSISHTLYVIQCAFQVKPHRTYTARFLVNGTFSVQRHNAVPLFIFENKLRNSGESPPKRVKISSDKNRTNAIVGILIQYRL